MALEKRLEVKVVASLEKAGSSQISCKNPRLPTFPCKVAFLPARHKSALVPGDLARLRAILPGARAQRLRAALSNSAPRKKVSPPPGS